MPQQTFDKNEINILYAPFTNVDKQRVGCDLAEASFEEAINKLCESNIYEANNAIFWLIVPIEEQFNAARIRDEYLHPSMKIKVISCNLKSRDDWFIVMSKSYKEDHDFHLSESSHFIYGTYLTVNTK